WPLPRRQPLSPRLRRDLRLPRARHRPPGGDGGGTSALRAPARALQPRLSVQLVQLLRRLGKRRARRDRGAGAAGMRFAAAGRAGSPRRRLLACLAATIAAGAVPRAAVAEPATLESILARIGGKSPREAEFTERKYLALLDAPVESSGLLRYVAPDRLERITRQPVAESMRLDGDLL